jgi:2-methylisocitrate lyase-like PEP mutase family enzyme
MGMSETRRDRVEAFRALHARDGAFVIPNPWDVGTARILAALGFEALASTSAGFAFSLGRLDNAAAVGRDEVLAHCAELVAATPLPVSADYENGYADAPADVAEAVRLAAATGLAGCSIEDATTDPAAPIYDFALAVERIAAAAEAARAVSGGFVLTARAENLIRGRNDLDDTIRRLQAFEAAGADVLYAPGLRDLETVRTVCAAVSKPVNVIVVGGLARATMAELSAAGAKRISIGSALSRAALGTVLKAAAEMREGGGFTWIEGIPGIGELSRFMVGPGEG